MTMMDSAEQDHTVVEHGSVMVRFPHAQVEQEVCVDSCACGYVHIHLDGTGFYVPAEDAIAFAQLVMEAAYLAVPTEGTH